MAPKTKSNTGIRNGDLFCFNCGTAFKMVLPQPVDMIAGVVKVFAKVHKDCAKTWTESVCVPLQENDTAALIKNANWWVAHGEHGMSSKTILNHLGKPYGLSIKNDYPAHPSDPDDFKRCYKLLQAVPQFKLIFNRMSKVSPVWSELVDQWDKLTEMYEQNVQDNWKNHKKIGMFEFMGSLGC